MFIVRIVKPRFFAKLFDEPLLPIITAASTVIGRVKFCGCYWRGRAWSGLDSNNPPGTIDLIQQGGGVFVA